MSGTIPKNEVDVGGQLNKVSGMKQKTETEYAGYACNTNFGFQSDLCPPDTDLYNFRARWYNPEWGRWLSPDPIGIEGGLNLYEFCHNDPVNFVDPYGEFTWSEWKEIGGAFAEGFGKGLVAGIDGMIPLIDPFADVYADDCGNVDGMYRVSRHIGGFTRDAMMTVAIPNIGTWVKNPAMYELGSTTVSPATWQAIKHLDTISRGKYLLKAADGNFLKASLQGFKNASQFTSTIQTGLTPSGKLLGIGALEWFDLRTR